MKTYIIVISSLIFGAGIVGAQVLVPTINSWDFKAIIQTDDGKNIKLYRFDDKEKNTSCYVGYMNGFTNGMSLGISCVK